MIQSAALNNACKLLTEAGIPYTTEDFHSNFNGTRIVFEKTRDARKAEQLLGDSVRVTAYFKQWQIQFFN